MPGSTNPKFYEIFRVRFKFFQHKIFTKYSLIKLESKNILFISTHPSVFSLRHSTIRRLHWRVIYYINLWRHNQISFNLSLKHCVILYYFDQVSSDMQTLNWSMSHHHHIQLYCSILITSKKNKTKKTKQGPMGHIAQPSKVKFCIIFYIFTFFPFQYYISHSRLQDLMLIVAAWHHSKFGRNFCIGQTTIQLKDFCFGEPFPRWYKLEHSE